MGFNDSWIIVRDMSKESLWESFGLEEVEAKPLRPTYGYIELTDGWSVIWSGPRGFDGRNELKDISRRHFALRLNLHDKTSWQSGLMAARGGEILWSVFTDNDGLLISKAAPQEFGPLKDLAQDFDGPLGDDYDVAPALAKAISGFDIDEFFGNIRYLQPKSGTPLAPRHPSWLTRSTGRPLLRAIEWWWYFCCDAGEFVGGTMSSVTTALLFIGLLSSPLIAAAWILGAIFRAP